MVLFLLIFGASKGGFLIVDRIFYKLGGLAQCWFVENLGLGAIYRLLEGRALSFAWTSATLAYMPLPYCLKVDPQAIKD